MGRRESGMKIFTDTQKWDDKWFRKLHPATKIIYLYLCDLSDHAGIWEFDGDMIRLHIGFEYSDEELRERILSLGAKIREMPNGVFWITNYVHFQNPKGISRRFKHCAPIYRSFEKHGIDPDKFQQCAIDLETEGNDVNTSAEVELQTVVDLWNTTCSELSAVSKLTSVRRSQLRAIIKEKISVFDLFNRVTQSDFLMGRSSKWKATFDWVIKPQNRIKIMEGNYANADRRGHSTEDYSKGF